MTDPIAHLMDDQSDDLLRAWRNHADYARASNFLEREQDALTQTLLQRDWGTAEHPGPSLWVLRGLVNNLFRDGGRGDLALKVLGSSEAIPEFVGHLWTHGWKRQYGLRDMAADASRPQPTAVGQLLEPVLHHFPHLLAWVCCDSAHLIGPKGPHWVEPISNVYPEDLPRKVKPNHNGDPYRSFLASILKDKHRASDEVLGKILAVDPFANELPETREKSLTEIATHYRSPVLLAYAQKRVLAEGLLETQGVDRKDRTYITLLIKKRQFDALRATGLDPKHVDEKGHNYFHHLIETWLPVTYNRNTDQWDPKPTAVLLAEGETIRQGWVTLMDLGCDPDQVCAPPGPVRQSKSTGRPVNWSRNHALPGETALDSLRRRSMDTTQGATFPAIVVDQLISHIREDRALRNRPGIEDTPAEGRRPRQRRRT